MMSYQPIYDGSFDVTLDGITTKDVVESIVKQKLMIVGYRRDGGAGCPEFTFRGTKRQIIGWLREFYGTAPSESTDDEVWAEAVDQDSIKQVA